MPKSILESGNIWLFEDVEFAEGDAVKDFVFEDEYVDILITVIGIVQGLILDLDQDIIDQDNAGERPL